MSVCVRRNMPGGRSRCCRRGCARFSIADIISKSIRDSVLSPPGLSSLQRRRSNSSRSNGDLQGHAEGVIIAAPAMPGAYLALPCVWEHKALNAKNFRAVARDGLARIFPRYSVQVCLYQKFLDKMNPALVTCVNSDTCETLHFALPYDAELAGLWTERAAEIIAATRGASFSRASRPTRTIGAAGCATSQRSAGAMQHAPKKNPANEPLDSDVVEKLGKMFLMMSSPNDGDKLAALHALNRALERNGVDYHTLVARMAKPWLSDAAKNSFKAEIANAKAIGRAEGLREAESKRGLESDLRSTDGSSDWREVALYVESRERQRLPSRNRDCRTFEFIDNMATNGIANSPA